MDNIKKFFKGVTSSSPDPIQSMQIILDSPSATYHTGEIISGHLIVQVNTSVNISQFEVKFSGKATVKLTDVSRRPSDRRESSTSVASNRNYCLESYNLVRLIYNPATVYTNALNAGRHDIGFSFVVPENVPSSLNHLNGQIEYFIKAKVKDLASAHKQKTSVTIVASPSVTHNELVMPICVRNNKTIGLFGKQGAELKCDIAQAGWVLGTTIPIQCWMKNESKKSMTLRASLKQNITFRAEGNSKVVPQKLTVATGPQLQPFSETTTTLNLVVPTNLPIIHNKCRLISVEYIVSVKLDIPGSFDLHCKMPVILTNKPFPLTGQQPPAPNHYPAPTSSVQQPPFTGPGVQMPPQPPPSYSAVAEPGSSLYMSPYPPVPTSGEGLPASSQSQSIYPSFADVTASAPPPPLPSSHYPAVTPYEVGFKG